MVRLVKIVISIVKRPFSSGVSVVLSLTFMQAFIPCIISFFLCKNVWKIALDRVPKAVVWFPFGFFSQDVECESTALSARCICESRGWSLTGNKSSERNVAADSHRQSKVPCKCICHIHEMAWGVAAENRHKALRVTEALPKSPSPCLSLPDPPVCHLPSRLSSRLTCGCHSGAATCSRHSNRRCHLDCRVLQSLWRAGRSAERRTPETKQVFFF